MSIGNHLKFDIYDFLSICFLLNQPIIHVERREPTLQQAAG
jgi:hypothetical protein